MEFEMNLIEEEIATDTAGDIILGIELGLGILAFLGVTCWVYWPTWLPRPADQPQIKKKNYVFIDEFEILSFTNSFSNLYLIDNLSELWYDEINDDNLSRLPLIEKEAIEYRKTIIVFVSSYGSCTNEDYINKHLLIQNDDILMANRLD